MSEKKLIVGLGNPGPQFFRTRHNVGFQTIDALFPQLEWKEKKGVNALLAKNGDIFFIKPITYMNNSGNSVFKVIDYYHIILDHLLVIHDEIDFPIGTTKLKKGGSSSHNGIKSVVQSLNTDNFWRLRIGIGRPIFGEIYNHVLGKFSKEEDMILEKVFNKLKQYQENLFTLYNLEKIRESFNRPTSQDN